MGTFSVGRKELVGDCFGQSPASSCLIPTLRGLPGSRCERLKPIRYRTLRGGLIHNGLPAEKPKRWTDAHVCSCRFRGSASSQAGILDWIRQVVDQTRTATLPEKGVILPIIEFDFDAAVERAA